MREQESAESAKCVRLDVSQLHHLFYSIDLRASSLPSGANVTTARIVLREEKLSVGVSGGVWVVALRRKNQKRKEQQVVR